MIPLWVAVATAVAAPTEPWTVSPELLTEVPMTVAAGVRVESPARLYAHASVGVLPRAYVKAANSVVTALWPDGYDEDTATLVEETLSRSVVLRARLGWRPLPARGWTFGAGTTLMALGGEATTAELIAGLTGTSVPATSQEPLTEVEATVVMVDLTTGWDVPVGPHVVLRPALGWSFTVWSRSDLDPTFEPLFPPGRAALDLLESEGEAYLDRSIRGYLHPPWIGVAVAWRFGT